jgi:hypothetical protein
MEVWLISLDLDDDEANALRRGENYPYIPDTGSVGITSIPGWWQQRPRSLLTRDVI